MRTMIEDREERYRCISRILLEGIIGLPPIELLAQQVELGVLVLVVEGEGEVDAGRKGKAVKGFVDMITRLALRYERKACQVKILDARFSAYPKERSRR